MTCSRRGRRGSRSYKGGAHLSLVVWLAVGLLIGVAACGGDDSSDRSADDVKADLEAAGYTVAPAKRGLRLRGESEDPLSLEITHVSETLQIRGGPCGDLPPTYLVVFDDPDVAATAVRDAERLEENTPGARQDGRLVFLIASWANAECWWNLMEAVGLPRIEE